MSRYTLKTGYINPNLSLTTNLKVHLQLITKRRVSLLLLGFYRLV